MAAEIAKWRGVVQSAGVKIGWLRRDAEAGALDRLGDGSDIRPFGQAHLAALEIDGKGSGARTRGGTRDGLYAAVAIHAGDLEDEFLSHVI